MPPRRLIQIFSYYILPLLLLLGVLIAESIYLGIYFSAKLGTAAFLLLTLTLFIKPISLLVSFKPIAQLMSYRRELGIGVFWLFAFHSFGLLYSGGYIPQDIFVPSGFIFWGWLAGMGLLVMALTSNDWAQQTLKRNWKKLHRIVYILYFFILYHSAVAQNEPEKIYLFGVPFIILKAIEFHPPTRSFVRTQLKKIT